MKFRISCAYFFVLSIPNSCRLWEDLQIKLIFSEDISDIPISNFCEKQLIPNGATLIVQNPFFTKKYRTLLIMAFPSVFEIAMLPVLSSFI